MEQNSRARSLRAGIASQRPKAKTIQSKAHQQQIAIGYRSDREAEVKQKLNPGETVD